MNRQYILSLFTTFLFSNIIVSQSFEGLTEFGNDYSWSFAQLESSSEELKLSLPSEIQDSFKVFCKDIYLHSLTMDDGLVNAVATTIADIESTIKYYFLYLRVHSSSSVISEYKSVINLPNYGDFSCFDADFITLLESTCAFKLNSNIPLNAFDQKALDIEKSVIIYLKSRVEDKLICCEDDIRARNNCSRCINPEDIYSYYSNRDFEVEEILIHKDEFGLPILMEPIIDSLILDFATILYRKNDTLWSPFYSLKSEMLSLKGNSQEIVGIILSNESLCYLEEGVPFRNIEEEAIDLFYNNFQIAGIELVVVYHLWENPSENGPDLLFKKYLYAENGNLEEADSPDNAFLGNSTPTSPVYPLTDLIECFETTELYEVTQDDNGNYYGYNLVNCNWIKADKVEKIIPASYPNPNSMQYKIGVGTEPATRTLVTTPHYSNNGILMQPKHYEYFPCTKCYEYSVGSKRSTPTEDIMRIFYARFSNLSGHDDDQDSLFNSFVYGKGEPVIWRPSSLVSTELISNSDISQNIGKIKDAIIDWVDQYGDLDGLFESNEIDNATNPNPNFSGLPLWAFQMFGGMQARSVKIVKFKKITNNSCSSKEKYYCEFIYSVYDNFGVDKNEKWLVPGLWAQWVLQHYRNLYLPSNDAFSPVVFHTIEFHIKFDFCK